MTGAFPAQWGAFEDMTGGVMGDAYDFKLNHGSAPIKLLPAPDGKIDEKILANFGIDSGLYTHCWGFNIL